MRIKSACFLFLAFFLIPAMASGQDFAAYPDTGLWMIDIDEVVVTAQVTPISSRKALQRIRSLDRQDIEVRGAVTLDQLLRQELNVRISQDPVLGAGLSLNGVSGQNVQIMIDGVPVIGRVGDGIDLSQINLSQIERVEIIEGPMSVRYGTNALGGVVNLITKKSQVPPLEANLEMQYQSIGWTTANTSIGVRLLDRLLLQAHLGGADFGGFNPDDPIQDRTFLWNPKDQLFGGASARFRVGEAGMLRYSLNAFSEEVRNPGIVRRPQFRPYAFDDTYRTKGLDHSLRHEGSIGRALHVQTTAAWNDFHRIKNTHRLDLDSGQRDEVTGMQDTAHFTSFLLNPVLASQDSSGRFKWQIGLDLRHETGAGSRIRDEQSSRLGYSEQGDYALFSSLSYAPISKLRFQLEGRVAHNTRYTAPLTHALHIKYDLSGALAIRASWAKGFRAPALKELFLYFVDANHFILGNDRLKAEKSLNAQLAVDWKRSSTSAGLVSASTQLYFNDISNKIALFQFEIQDDVMVPVTEGGSLKYAYFNQAQFQNAGANLQFGFAFGRFSANFGFAPTLLYNPLSERDPAVKPWSSIHQTNGMLTFRPKWHDLRLSFLMKHNDRLISFYETIDETTGEPIAGVLRQEGFTIADFTASRSFAKRTLTVTAGVQNLFDVTNVAFAGQSTGTHAPGDNQVIAVGRTFFLRMSLRFSQEK